MPTGTSFRDLPRELRDIVYKFAIGKFDSGGCPARLYARLSYLRPLLCSHPQVRKEGLEHFFQNIPSLHQTWIIFLCNEHQLPHQLHDTLSCASVIPVRAEFIDTRSILDCRSLDNFLLKNVAFKLSLFDPGLVIIKDERKTFKTRYGSLHWIISGPTVGTLQSYNATAGITRVIEQFLKRLELILRHESADGVSMKRLKEISTIMENDLTEKLQATTMADIMRGCLDDEDQKAT